MSDFFSAAASAALPVSVVLLVLGLIARGVLWAQIDDPRWQRPARQHLEPLSTWAVAGFIVYALTLVAAGEAATAPLALALVLAVAAAVLRVETEEEPRAATAPAGHGASAAPPGDELAPERAAAATWGHEFPPSRGEAATSGRELAPERAAAATPRDSSGTPTSHLWDGDAEPAAPGGLWAREAR